MEKATAIVHAGPAIGANFTHYTAEMEEGGKLGPTIGERFCYVLSGQVQIGPERLNEGGYAFAPVGSEQEMKAVTKTRLLVIEKPYQQLEDTFPIAFTGNVGSVERRPLLGDEGVLVQALVPDQFEFDFAVNLLTFVPGAALPLVEVHVMEHGLMMLEGGGIYRLGDYWYPVLAGDFIWMAPYCPQWFGAIGKTAASYLLYKDWNRHPL